MEENEVELDEVRPRSFWRETGTGLLVLAFFLAIIFILHYKSVFDAPVDWSVRCGEFKGDLEYSDHTFLQDTQQVMCTFDNGVVAFVDDGNGGFITNPGYRVCYRFWNLVDGEWKYGGQTC